MDNNDILIRLRYALDIKDIDMIKMFDYGGVQLSKLELKALLTKTDDGYNDEAKSHDELNEKAWHTFCTNRMLESFLNGFIIFKRGQRPVQPGETPKPVYMLKENVNVNNVFLKKVKIALALTSDQIMTIFNQGGITLSKGELSALFRKKGHKHYRECGDKFARNFLKGLAQTYRKQVE